MNTHNVRHYLEIYTTRMEMQEKGVTNPSKLIKEFTKSFVEKLKSFPLDEDITLRDNSFYDSKGNLIIKVPVE